MDRRPLSKPTLVAISVVAVLAAEAGMRVEVPVPEGLPPIGARLGIRLDPPVPWEEVRAERLRLCQEDVEVAAARCQAEQTNAACQAWMSQAWSCEQWEPEPQALPSGSFLP